MMQPEPGLIGVACGDTSRYSDFLPSIVGLAKPPGTGFMKATGLGPADPFNQIGRRFMESPQFKWLFLTNDDNLVPIDTIYRLLAHNVDVVGGLYLSRIQPFQPVAFDAYLPLEDHPETSWFSRYFPQPGEHGLKEIVGTGDGCLLIRRHVMEAIPEPWWEYGLTVTDACDHDMVLCHKIRAAGFKIWLDLDLMVDHIAPMVVRPVRKTNGEWEVHLAQGIGRAISVPMSTGERVK